MKLRLTAFALIGIISTAQAANSDTKLELKDKTDKVSYSIGIDIGKSFKEQSIAINEKAFLKGVRDGQSQKDALMNDEEIRETLLGLQNELVEKQKAETKKMSMKNKAEGEKFLAENKKRDGIQTLPSGLQYRVVKKGNGSEKPGPTDTVTTHYRGKLIDGTEFDSSYSRGEPVSFTVNGVIPGWTEALQMMSPGAKWELYIPADLAYGEQGIGNIIPPNSALTFEVELLSIEKDKKAEDKKN